MDTQKSSTGLTKPAHSNNRNQFKGKQIPKDTLTNMNQIYAENQLAPRLDPLHLN